MLVFLTQLICTRMIFNWAIRHECVARSIGLPMILYLWVALWTVKSQSWLQECVNKLTQASSKHILKDHLCHSTAHNFKASQTNVLFIMSCFLLLIFFKFETRWRRQYQLTSFSQRTEVNSLQAKTKFLKTLLTKTMLLTWQKSHYFIAIMIVYKFSCQ